MQYLDGCSVLKIDNYNYIIVVSCPLVLPRDYFLLLSDCPETSNLLQAFTTDEIINALKATKAGKAAGPDEIFPDMLKNIGPAAIQWLQAFYDDVVSTAKIPKIWRSANVIAIRKLGKPLDDPTSYRPISLLCC